MCVCVWVDATFAEGDPPDLARDKLEEKMAFPPVIPMIAKANAEENCDSLIGGGMSMSLHK